MSGFWDKVLDTFRTDGFKNLITKAGTRRDKREGGTFCPRIFDRDELDDLYHASPLAARICDLIADDMTREGIKLKGPSPEVITGVHQKFESLNAWSVIADGIRWSRLQGSALVFIGAVDGQTDLSQPLNLDAIESVEYLEVFDCHELQIKTRDSRGEPVTYAKVMYADPSVDAARRVKSPQVGEPIHASRFIRFDGTKTSRRRKRDRNNGWADSVFVRLFNTIRGYESSWVSAEALLQDFAQAVIKIQGLAELMATEGEDKVLARLEMIDTGRSSLRAMILDAENEDFDRKPTPMSGLPEVLDRFLSRVAGAAEMPITLLFGTSPGGLNATGDSDVRFFYDTVKRKQRRELTQPLEYLLQIIFRSKDGPSNGTEPDTWSFAFNPLWQLSDTETAALRKTVAETDQIYFNSGIVRESEIAESRFNDDGWSMETKLDWEVRNAQAAAELEAAAGGDDVQKQAYNGAQGATLLSTIQLVAAGSVPREAGARSISLLFQITESEAMELLGPAGTPAFTPAAPAAPATPVRPEGRPEGNGGDE